MRLKESIFKKIINLIFYKLFKINDTPHKVALGVGLGVFAGLLPGTGPIAALFMAFVFRANRAAALLSSMITNTWLSLVTFILAIKAGSVILKVDWQRVQQQALGLIKDFSWAKLFKISFLDVLLPVFTGYLIIGLFLGSFCYLITLLIINRRNFHGNKTVYP